MHISRDRPSRHRSRLISEHAFYKPRLFTRVTLYYLSTLFSIPLSPPEFPTCRSVRDNFGGEFALLGRIGNTVARPTVPRSSALELPLCAPFPAFPFFPLPFLLSFLLPFSSLLPVERRIETST